MFHRSPLAGRARDQLDRRRERARLEQREEADEQEEAPEDPQEQLPPPYHGFPEPLYVNVPAERVLDVLARAGAPKLGGDDSGIRFSIRARTSAGC